jgi:hypothetical protein
MATNLSQTGFWPEANSNDECIQLKRVRVASGNGTAIFMGDCVARTGAGVWGLATAGGGNPVSGIAQGASYLDSTQLVRKENMFLPASTTYSGTAFDYYGETDNSFIYITSDQNSIRYRCQYSASTPALTDITKNAAFVAGAGSTITGISGHTLDQTTLQTTNTLAFAITDIKRNVLNDVTSVNAKVIVQINVSNLAGGPGTTGTGATGQ